MQKLAAAALAALFAFTPAAAEDPHPLERYIAAMLGTDTAEFGGCIARQIAALEAASARSAAEDAALRAARVLGEIEGLHRRSLELYDAAREANADAERLREEAEASILRAQILQEVVTQPIMYPGEPITSAGDLRTEYYASFATGGPPEIDAAELAALYEDLIASRPEDIAAAREWIAAFEPLLGVPFETMRDRICESIVLTED